MTTITTIRENPPLSADEVLTRALAAIARVDGQVGNRAITGLCERDIEALVIVAALWLDGAAA